MKPTILYLENDPEFSERALDVLLKEYDVLLAESVIEGLNIIEKNKDKIILFLVDSMLPTEGEVDIRQADGGILTGLLFYKKVCKEMYTKQEKVPPIIFLTALKLDEKTMIKKLGNTDYSYIRKIDLNTSLDDLNNSIKEKIKFMLEKKGNLE